jgi:hypothetical protein
VLKIILLNFLSVRRSFHCSQFSMTLFEEILKDKTFQHCFDQLKNESVPDGINHCFQELLKFHYQEHHTSSSSSTNESHVSSLDHDSAHHDGGYSYHHYHLTNYFEFAVECVNSLAGLIVLFAVFLTFWNLLVIIVNAVFGSFAFRFRLGFLSFF